MNKVLKLLCEDARLTAAQIAVMLGRTEAEVAADIDRLEKEGVIRGYKPLIDWDKAGDEFVTAIIELQVIPSKDQGFEALANTIMAFDEVESLSLMSGSHDLSVTVSGRSFKDVAMFVATRLSPLDGVQDTATSFVLKKYKERGVLFTQEEKDERGNI